MKIPLEEELTQVTKPWNRIRRRSLDAISDKIIDMMEEERMYII